MYDPPCDGWGIPWLIIPERTALCIDTVSPHKCWCQDETIDFRHGEGTCDFRCSGDETTFCGGFDSFSLYKLEEAVLPTSPTVDSYVGCFADDRNDRVLIAMTSSREMTSEVCRRTYPEEQLCTITYLELPTPNKASAETNRF